MRELQIEKLPVARGRPLVGVTITLALVALAWAARVAADPLLPSGFPYVTFFPAVIVTSFLFGVRLGALSALLSGLLAWYFFVSPVHPFDLTFGAQVALAFYVFVVATDLALVHWMQTANQQLVRQREINRNLAESKELIVRELQDRIRERDEAADDLLQSQVQTQLATRTAGIGLWQWNVRTGEVHWDRTMFELYGMTPTPDGLVRYADYIASLHPDDAAAQDAILHDTVATCGGSQREFRIRRSDDGSVRHIRAVEIARPGADGAAEWVVGTNLDVSDQRNREARIRLLMEEVNHRAKNMLGVVMAVAKQTRAPDHDAFMVRFAERIESLAASQDLLVVSQWNGVQLESLAHAQLSHFRDLIGSRILLSGPSAPLLPSAVQTIGIVLHELATNASKHGALSNDQGRVTVRWELLPGARPDRFVLHWTESGGPPVVPPSRLGFGSTVIGKMVQMSVDGEVSIDFAPTGLSWRLDCPSANVIGDERPLDMQPGERP